MWPTKLFLVRNVRFLDLDAEVAEVWHVQGFPEQSAVGYGVGAHPLSALRRQGTQFRDQPALLVEVLLRLVTAQPFFQQLQMGRVGLDIRERDLVGAARR